jgi:hypothetical protein
MIEVSRTARRALPAISSGAERPVSPSALDTDA